jgi:hypothetical protein
MIFALAIIAVALAGQPAKSPEKQGIAKGGSTQSAGQANNPANTNQQSNPEMSSGGNIPANTSETHTAQSDEQIQIERTVEIFTGLLVIAAFLQAGIFYWQGRVFRRTLNAINRQAEISQQQVAQMIEAGKQTDRIITSMDDTAIKELRAYVCVSKAYIAFVHERAPEIQVHIKNCGKTPAYDIRTWIGVGLGQYPVEASYLKPPPRGMGMSGSVLGPGDEPQGMVFFHPVIPEEQMAILGTPELTLFAFGEISYKDAFGKRHMTKYRLMFGGEEPCILRDENGIATAFLRSDTEGNEAD